MKYGVLETRRLSLGGKSMWYTVLCSLCDHRPMKSKRDSFGQEISFLMTCCEVETFNMFSATCCFSYFCPCPRGAYFLETGRILYINVGISKPWLAVLHIPPSKFTIFEEVEEENGSGHVTLLTVSSDSLS